MTWNISLDDKSVFCSLFLACVWSWQPSLWVFWGIEMRVSSISPPNLSLIRPLTIEFYYWTEIWLPFEAKHERYHYTFFFLRIEMWVSCSISPPNLSVNGPLTTEIYYRKRITGNTHRQTNRQTDRQIERWIHRQMDRQAYGQTDSYTDSYTDRQSQRLNLIFSTFRVK